MIIKLENPSVLAKAVEIISELVTEVKLKVNEFGISVTAIDPANVSMVEFKIPKSSFSHFESDNEALGINLDDFKRILKRCGIGSSLILEKRGNLLGIQIQDRIKRNFSLSLIDIEREDKEMPNLDFDVKAELNSLDFISSVEDCSIVADACSFIAGGGKFIIEAKGLNSARTEFSESEARIESLKSEQIESRYSLEYLQKFTKGAKLCEKTILKFSEDSPLKVEFKTPQIELSFILAPRVKTED